MTQETGQNRELPKIEFNKNINTALCNTDTRMLEGNWSNYGKVNLGAAFTWLLSSSVERNKDAKV